MFARARAGILLALYALIACAVLAPYIVLADVIDDFAVTVTIRTDRSVEVTELIRYDFGDAERHGIYRDIAATYINEDGVKQSVMIDGITVHDGTMAPVLFESFKNGDDLRLKIGHPDVLVTGKRTYEISYVAHDVIAFFDDHDELYWNATGNDWLLPIQHVSARVYAPASTTVHACFVGPRGSTIPCETQQSIAGDGSAWFFEATYALGKNEGMTFAIGWPTGVVMPPSEREQIMKKMMKFLPLLLPVIALVFLFYRWWRHGRDDRGRGTIIPEYDVPKGVNTTIASMLMFERVSAASLSATMIELAVRGYLTIHREEEKTLGIFTSIKYRFDKNKSADDELAPDERAIYNVLFAEGNSVWMSDEKLGARMIAARSTVSRDAASQMVLLGYYYANPTKLKVLYFVAAAAVFILGFALTAVFQSPSMIIATLITSMMIGLFGLIMPAKTKKGTLLKEQILGLKDYLQIAEKDRLDFHHAPEKSPQLFEKLLPYAMILGVSAAWAKEFEGIYEKPPEWYGGASYAAFTPMVFANDMTALSTAVTTLATPTSSGGGASGGGFSGGGFGGGGGGSW